MSNANLINKYQKITSYYIAAHIFIYGIAAYFLGAPLFLPMFMQAILAVTAYLGSHVFYKTCLGKDLSAMSLVLTPAVLVYILTGHEWQIDAHMYFFATLAMVTAFQDGRATLFAAGAVAVHHLSLNFVLPVALFPDDANLWRVIFHAVIVVIETGVLVLFIRALNNMYSAVNADKARAELALKDAEEARLSVAQSQDKAEKQRQEHAHSIASKLDETADQIIAVFVREADSLQNVSEQIAHLVESTSNATKDVASQSDEAKEHVGTVVSAAHQLSASIRTISENVRDTIETTKHCTQTANLSMDTLNSLQQAVGEIDGVIQAITDVAEQTNLLALNATIEAARAGEAGKGFAVVANEVKALANQTHKMTDEITNRVGLVKTNAQETVSRVEDIIRQINDVNVKTTSVAQAIEEQSSATYEIENRINLVSSSTDKITGKISDIQNVSNESNQGKDALMLTARTIKDKSSELQSEVNNVIKTIRES